MHDGSEPVHKLDLEWKDSGNPEVVEDSSKHDMRIMVPLSFINSNHGLLR